MISVAHEEAAMDKRYCGQENTPCTSDGDCCLSLQCAIPGNFCSHTIGKRGEITAQGWDTL